MKKLIYLIIIVLISGLVLTGCSVLSDISQVPAIDQTKVKPESNPAGAVEVPWNLSGAVMPVPPWGLHDIIGSDTASKLIFNQPNGNVEVAVTGVMKGLDPNTEYTVCPSYAWSTSEKWNIVGDWELRFMLGTGIYDHDMSVTSQNMYTDVFSGTGHNSHNWDILGTSRVVGDTIHLDIDYQGSTYIINATGTIDENGFIVNGNWNSNNAHDEEWFSISGNAEKETVGNGYSGRFLGKERFTFTTDEFGAGSWHFNLKNGDFDGPGTYELSVWINKGGTILISNNFTVVVE